MCFCLFFFQAEDGIRDLVRSRGLGDVYKRQGFDLVGDQAACGVALHFGGKERARVIKAQILALQLSLIHI